MLTLYHAPTCPYCVRTRIVLREKGIAWEDALIDLSDRDPALRELNPRNRVPVIVDGDLVLYESAVIDEYLEDRHPEPALMPADAAGRALVRLTIDRFDELSGAYYDLRRAQRGGTDAAPALRAVDEELAWLERRLARHPYIAGEAYSLADPSWWPWVARLPGLGVELERHPAVAEWCRRVEERPAVAAELAVI